MGTTVKASLVFVVGVGGVLAAGLSAAQSYPTKSVRLIVPAAPGGGLDIMARAIAQPLAAMWGQSVIVHNRPRVTGERDIILEETSERYCAFPSVPESDALPARRVESDPEPSLIFLDAGMPLLGLMCQEHWG